MDLTVDGEQFRREFMEFAMTGKEPPNYKKTLQPMKLGIFDNVANKWWPEWPLPNLSCVGCLVAIKLFLMVAYFKAPRDFTTTTLKFTCAHSGFVTERVCHGFIDINIVSTY